MGAERVGKCTCPGKIKVKGILRCKTHEPEFFADCSQEVLVAMKNPKPPASKPSYFEQKLPPPSL